MNKLTESQIERLIILSEECAEVIQVVSKIIRFGYEDFNPYAKDIRSNRERLEEELGDVLGAMQLFNLASELNNMKILDAKEKKLQKFEKFTKYQDLTND